MMNLRQLAEETAKNLPKKMFYLDEKAAIIHSALLQAIRQFAQREVSEEVIAKGVLTYETGVVGTKQKRVCLVYKAMLAQALKELEQEE